MRPRKRLPYLRLVEAEEANNQHLDTPDRTPGWDAAVQISLFSGTSTQTLGFIAASRMSAGTFERLLEDVKPRIIFDVRQVPLFSDGTLTRSGAFSLFSVHGIRYFDVAGAVEVQSSRDAVLNPGLLIPYIMERLLKSKRAIIGPVLFFVDDPQLNEFFIDGIAAALPNAEDRGWEISVWEQPNTEAVLDAIRDVVFVSHANPEDNDIARWFATRLSAEGFAVWSDLTDLKGGEFFWDTIERIIRKRAAAVVVLLSKKGHEKSGVLDEVNVAITTERKEGLKNFVIPVRIDGIEFSELRANLARKQIIDGADNLGAGASSSH